MTMSFNTDVNMRNTASSTRSGRIVGPRAQEEYFFHKINVCFLQTILFKQNIGSCKLFDLI